MEALFIVVVLLSLVQEAMARQSSNQQVVRQVRNNSLRHPIRVNPTNLWTVAAFKCHNAGWLIPEAQAPQGVVLCRSSQDRIRL